MKKTLTTQKGTLTFKNGLYDGLPIGLGYLSVSIAFGIQASMLGLPIFISIMISMTNLTSAGQLAGLTVIAMLGTVLEIILTQLIINSRYFLMSLTLSQKLDNSFNTKERFFFSAFITDEIFAVSSAKQGLINKKYFLGVVILPYIGWSLGTLLGALLGNSLPLEITNALGIALYAMFIAIIIPPSISVKGVFPAVIIATGLSCALHYISVFATVSQGFKYIICAVLASMITAYFFPIEQAENDKGVK